MAHFSNLVFDLDGTLTDSKIAITGRILHALSTIGMGTPAATELEWCIGPPLWDVFARLITSHDPTVIGRAIDSCLERYEIVGLRGTVVYPGIAELLGEFRAHGAEIFLVTSKLGDHGEKILDHFGLLPFFTRAYGTARDGSLQTKSQLLATILRNEKLNADETAMIGDRAHDMIAARENGVVAIGVTYGYGTRAELENAGAVAAENSERAENASVLRWAAVVSAACKRSCDRSSLGLFADSVVGRLWS